MEINMLFEKRYAITVISLLISIIQLACVSCTPAWIKYDQVAKDLQFSRTVITTTYFNITAYKNRQFGYAKRLHIYLDGDGSPWKSNGLLINDDPTPHSYLVLQLMSLDSSPAILIGRPCYHGFNRDSYCHSLLWTHARYSEKVVSAISDALRIILKENNVSEVILIGYSGGGTLAQLLAEKIQKTRAVVTLAGNFDLVAWAQLHEYSPLEGSLNPAERLPLPVHILQIHYVGSADDNIPPSLTEHYLSRKGMGEIQVLKGVDHYNGWLVHWPEIMLNLKKRLL